MEITIFDGKVSAADLTDTWEAAHGNLISVTKSSKRVIVEILDADARDLIDELDRLGMNYEEEKGESRTSTDPG